MGLSTRPYGAGFSGLCERDSIWLKYAPTNLDDEAADQPLQAYGVETQASFHALRSPGTGLSNDAAAENVWDQECDRLAGRAGIIWFNARNADDAVQALRLLRAATDKVRAGELTPKACDLFPNNRRTCAQTMLDEGDPQQIHSVAPCAADPGFECFTIDAGDLTELTIVGRKSADQDAPASVESVTVAQLIVVT